LRFTLSQNLGFVFDFWRYINLIDWHVSRDTKNPVCGNRSATKSYPSGAPHFADAKYIKGRFGCTVHVVELLIVKAGIPIPDPFSQTQDSGLNNSAVIPGFGIATEVFRHSGLKNLKNERTNGQTGGRRDSWKTLSVRPSV